MLGIDDPPTGTDPLSHSTTQVQSSFPQEKEQLFNTRYEEGYDLPDEEYEEWLWVTHPEAVNTTIAGMFRRLTALNQLGEDEDEILHPFSFTRNF